MAKPLFAKYNGERSLKFRTSTTIVIKNRKKTVIKSPLCKEAVFYVESLASFRDRLSFAYEGSNLKVAPCTKSDDNLLIDFIAGKSLDEIIAKKTNGDPSLLKKEFQNFAELICGCGLVPFKPSPDFKKIFGEIVFEPDVKCLTITSLSLFAHNIISDKEGSLNLVDFDFCFDFHLPLNYILYRALKALKKRHGFKGIDSSTVLDITSDEKKLFRLMEERFDRFVNSGDTLCETTLTDKFLKPQFDAVAKRYRTDGNNHKSYLFYDIGDGFNELNKIEAVSVLNGDIYEVRFTLPSIVGIKKLRFDPIEGVGSEISIVSAAFDNELQTLTAVNRTDCFDNYDIFHHLDPIYETKLESELPPLEIAISYKMNIIDFETLYKVTDEKLSQATAKKGFLNKIFNK